MIGNPHNGMIRIVVFMGCAQMTGTVIAILTSTLILASDDGVHNRLEGCTRTLGHVDRRRQTWLGLVRICRTPVAAAPSDYVLPSIENTSPPW
jgi:hypothetical protein